MDEGPPAPEEKESESTDSEEERRQKLQKSWRTAARRARNKERFERMVRQNSQVLYRALVKELITQRQKSFITDIPGFSYFLLLKYTLDLDDITDIMSEMG
jgi:formiminotetrahydrofolate cyclodeaminase